MNKVKACSDNKYVLITAIGKTYICITGWYVNCELAGTPDCHNVTNTILFKSNCYIRRIYRQVFSGCYIK